MDEAAPVYQIERIEQMRAMADELRLRALDALSRRALTVTQLAELLGEAPNRLHYHVRELERVGLVRLVETREKGGILEKYYRAVAERFIVPDKLLRGDADETTAAAADLLQLITHGFMRALTARLRAGSDPAAAGAAGVVSLEGMHLWMTTDELREVSARVEETLAPYRDRRGLPGEQELSVYQLVYPAALARDADSLATEAAPDAAASPVTMEPQPRTRRVVAAGGIVYRRPDLEAIVAHGERLDLNILGVATIDDDVPAALADRAIARFRHRGILHASDAVRAVLARKARDQDKDQDQDKEV